MVSPHPAVTAAGVEILSAGGNAVDAAIAAAFALAVAQPQSTGIGGGGFLLIRLADGRAFAIDARETAPAAATPDLYTRPGVPENASLVGGLAVGTPGLVAGLALALEAHGTLPLARVLAPAIRLAEEGYAVGAYQARFVEEMGRRGVGARFPELARIHFPPGPATARTRIVQADLARTLRAIAALGPRAFYEGPVARAPSRRRWPSTAASSRAGDLARYRPVVRQPLVAHFRGFEVLAFPPPSSGGVTLLEILNVLEGFELARLGAGSSASDPPHRGGDEAGLRGPRGAPRRPRLRRAAGRAAARPGLRGGPARAHQPAALAARAVDVGPGGARDPRRRPRLPAPTTPAPRTSRWRTRPATRSPSPRRSTRPTARS